MHLSDGHCSVSAPRCADDGHSRSEHRMRAKALHPREASLGKYVRPRSISVRPEALLATSTAALSIDGLAEGLAAPSRLVGLHVASPVELWGIVEIVRGRRSAAAALARAHDAAGFLGNLGRNFLRGPEFWQGDLMFSKDFRFRDTHGIQVRVEIFNITNHLNYENPAVSLPNGAPGTPSTLPKSPPTTTPPSGSATIALTS